MQRKELARVETAWVRVTFEECCDSSAVAVKSSKVQHGQAVLTLTNPRFRPESKIRLQTRRVIIYRCHDGIVAKEPDALVTPMASCGFLHVDHLLKIELELTNVVHDAQEDVDVAIPATCQILGGSKSDEKGRAIAFEIKQSVTITLPIAARTSPGTAAAPRASAPSGPAVRCAPPPPREQSRSAGGSAWPRRLSSARASRPDHRQGWGIRMYGSDTPVSTPFLALFPPFFRRFFALPGFLAPRRRERAKDGGKWAKNGRNRGAETPEIIRIPHPWQSPAATVRPPRLSATTFPVQNFV